MTHIEAALLVMATLLILFLFGTEAYSRYHKKRMLNKNDRDESSSSPEYDPGTLTLRPNRSNQKLDDDFNFEFEVMRLNAERRLHEQQYLTKNYLNYFAQPMQNTDLCKNVDMIQKEGIPLPEFQLTTSCSGTTYVPPTTHVEDEDYIFVPKQLCPKCEGIGQYAEQWPSGHRTILKWIDCKICNGDGVIPMHMEPKRKQSII